MWSLQPLQRPTFFHIEKVVHELLAAVTAEEEKKNPKNPILRAALLQAGNDTTSGDYSEPYGGPDSDVDATLILGASPFHEQDYLSMSQVIFVRDLGTKALVKLYTIMAPPPTIPEDNQLDILAVGLPGYGGASTFKQELLVRRTLRHQSLVPLVGVCSQMQPPLYFYEYMEQGCLRDYLMAHAIGTPTLLQMALDIGLGMEYIAAQPMVRVCVYICV